MIEIKPAGISHIDKIQELAMKIWPGTYGSILTEAQMEYMLDLFYSHEVLEKQITDPNHHFIIAFENNQAIGFASCSPHDDDPKIFHLHKIYVLPEMHGKSIGIKLLDHIISSVKNDGGRSLQLNVNRFNRAFHFYTKHGFTVIREEDNDIGKGHFMNDYVMGKAL